MELVESGELSGPHAEKVVGESLKPLLAQGADTIVLGCTHYPFLMDVIRKIAGPGINIINPAPAVARHLAEVYEEDVQGSAGQKDSGEEHLKLLSSGDDTLLKRFTASLL